MRPETQARIAAARAARDLSDLARQTVGTTAEPMTPTERIRRARQLRKLANDVVDLVVLAEALGGADWQEITDALNRLDTATVQDEYADAVAEWDALPDADDAGAEDLDDWYARHREDHDPGLEKPVTELLNRR
ncbi:hypothetical protein [Streptomyces sp. NPDC047315]|uniref:hypothetical protein n=1 Tax=Streptomyces sp. NPDC047315 TaxID=3155142 RepID=UPI0033C14F88